MATSYVLEQRVNRMEDAMAEMARVVAQTSRELADFKNEMQDFKSEVHFFIEESRASRIEMNRRWGELSNKMGTMAEDLVAPNIPRILRTVLGCPDDAIEQTGVRMLRRSSVNPAIRREFDVIASYGNYFLINETKSRLSPQDVDKFVETLSSAREFFPEATEKQIVGAIAFLYVDESLARFAERNGVIVLDFGENVMGVLNSHSFSPRFF